MRRHFLCLGFPIMLAGALSADGVKLILDIHAALARMAPARAMPRR